MVKLVAICCYVQVSIPHDSGRPETTYKHTLEARFCHHAELSKPFSSMMCAKWICDHTVISEKIRPIFCNFQIHHRRVKSVRVRVAQIHYPLSLIHVQGLVLMSSLCDQRGMIANCDPVGLAWCCLNMIETEIFPLAFKRLGIGKRMVH